MSKLVAGNYAQFTLSGPDKVRTSGVIVTKDTSTITYQDEDTKLLCTIPMRTLSRFTAQLKRRPSSCAGIHQAGFANNNPLPGAPGALR